MNFGETFLRLDAHTVHGARLFIGKQCHGLRIEADLDTKLLGLLHERQGQLAATRLVFANNEMCAGKHRPDKLGTSRKVDAAITVKPFKGGIGVFANNTSELFISLALRDLHPVLEELFGGIALNILGLLEGGIDAKEEARSINRVARRHGHLFKKKRLEAVFSRAHGTGEAATTSAQMMMSYLEGAVALASAATVPNAAPAPTAPMAAVLKNSRREVVICLFSISLYGPDAVVLPHRLKSTIGSSRWNLKHIGILTRLTKSDLNA